MSRDLIAFKMSEHNVIIREGLLFSVYIRNFEHYYYILGFGQFSMKFPNALRGMRGSLLLVAWYTSRWMHLSGNGVTGFTSIFKLTTSKA